MGEALEILVIHLGALGDFVLSWPALGRLMAGPPPGRVTLVGRPEWGGLILPPERCRRREDPALTRLWLAEGHPGVDAWLAGFDRAVVMAHRPDPDLLAHLCAVLGQEAVWPLATRPGPGEVRHAGDMQAEALAARGLSGPAVAPPLRREGTPPPAAPVLAPGSGGRDKRLTPERAGERAAWLADEFGPPVLVLGPAEEPAYREALAGALDGVPHRVMADPSPAVLAARLAGARPFLGPDSGPTHLAAALGAPTLALFGPSDPRLWAPRGPRVRVLPLDAGDQAMSRAVSSMDISVTSMA